MEDRYDISVDIGEGKDWWYVHGLATHDKVYELNRQMCDIDKHLSEAGYFGMICEGQVEARKKLKDMEEKKTKKMTKAEAFEYLKGKKVKCYKVGEHYGEELLKKLTECGCTSNIFLPKGILSVWAIFISDVCDLSILNTAHADQYGNYDLCEISADDILSIEIVDDEDNIAEKKAFQQARDIMKWLREEQSPHTLMIIDGYHVELLDGVKAEVWKE